MKQSIKILFWSLNAGCILVAYWYKQALAWPIFWGIIFIQIVELFLTRKATTAQTQMPLNLIPTELLPVLTSYICFSFVKPQAAETLDLVFWGMMAFEMIIQYLTFKKFRIFASFRPILGRLFNYIQTVLFASLMVLDFTRIAFWILIALGFVSNLDLLLTVIWLPYFKSDVKSCLQAYQLKSEYHKIYKH